MTTDVVILAGGKGTRLRPLTAVFPKPLVPLGDTPVLEILLRQLRNYGFGKIHICTGYLAELIMGYCGNGSKYGLDISYVREESPLGTAGPLSQIDDLSDPVIVMNGDLLTTLHYGKMIEYHRANNADFTIALYERDVRIDFGVVERNENGDFSGFIEKPTYHYEVSMGVNVMSKSARQYIQPNQHLDMPDLILKMHADGLMVCCYRESDCFWLDIGRMDDYAVAQETFSENREMFFRGNE